MPGSSDIAFVLGQSKALHLSEETLSVMGYLKKHMPDKPEEERQQVAIQYAFSIIKFGLGGIKESALPDDFPIQDDSIRRGRHTLLVIQLGRVLETGKRLLVSASGKYPTPNEVECASLPLGIPVEIDKDAASALAACMMGMIDTTTWWKYEEKRHLSDEERSEFESALKGSREIVEAYQSSRADCHDFLHPSLLSD
ncbi:hypothetical protein J3458_002706 [Metarhizium acridum]|uniref:uncharacterized protein n=1 Tax=Metarhizium acridum TaxID=92637 RepID=UPI001C6C3817|nr:hypothetical protein J3458_002706 [Metarhizium acridum]